ncbi:MAG TPA: DUF302 domain-containing protein, partial [Bacteroidales bacterium]|nr:DUF302 domain-containing protein [Bacteroidales bacterium]
QYYFTTVLPVSFEDTIPRVEEALKSEGFGIISDIDMRGKFKEKMGVDFRKYRILGACNPPYALKALQLEEKIGTMLPCNVIVVDQGGGCTAVSAVNPVASMMAVDNPNLQQVAEEVTVKLQRVIASLKGSEG